MPDSSGEAARRVGLSVRPVRGEDVVRRGINAVGIAAWRLRAG